MQCSHKKKNIIHAFTNRFARIFQSTFVLAHSRSKSGSLGAVIRDHRYTRQSAFWLISSPSCFSLQRLCASIHWHIRTKGHFQANRRLTNWLGDLQAFISSFFLAFLFLLAKYLEFKAKHGHYLAKRNKLAEKKEEMKACRSPNPVGESLISLEIAFFSSVLSPEGKGQCFCLARERCRKTKTTKLIAGGIGSNGFSSRE
ncbi:hypothetical protein H5410_002621 [Solanum commersonii]|uniref:Uncharacterized protein n=1 Tax=Solanum commersonii TaxID=4109 RepID=A0A9J6B2M7_SOLCO|nr:hypothetical protein H5410_002621 [Solanum commersonii]